MLKPASLLLSALLLFSGDLSAQQVFKNQPGQMELSGRMVARPLQDGPNLKQAQGRLLPYLLRHESRIDMYVLELPAGMTEDAFSAELMATGDYEFVEPDWICYPVLTPNDPNFNQQWHHQNMESEAGWDTRTDASTVIAAFTDTGVDTNHPDLTANLIEGFDQVFGLWESQGGDIEDINGHGTYVAGCIGAEGNNNLGVAGIAWNIQLLPIRVSHASNGGAYISDLQGGAMEAADAGAKTVSTSYSGISSSGNDATGSYIKSQGGLWFYAAGNWGDNWSWFDYADVIIVGATRSNDNLTSWSSYGLAVDCVAPGESIETTSLGGGYAAPSGTSFSTPLASAVAAMVFAHNPGISAQAAEDMLLQNCIDLGSAGEDNTFGNGLVTLKGAIEAGGGGGGPLNLSLGSLVGGWAANADVTNCTPGAVISLNYSRFGLGSSFDPITGETLGIQSHTLVSSMLADPTGTASFWATVPSRGTGLVVWVQAAEAGNLSNIASSVIL